MSDHDALLAAIIANPADDTPRLVYADWLEENGRPERAEFIRVQVELARHPVAPRSNESGEMVLVFATADQVKEHDGLRRRERELEYAHGQQWFPPLECGNGLMHAYVSSQFRINTPYMNIARGFVSSLTCSWDDWRTHADAITRAQPVERVRLTTVPDPRVPDFNQLRNWKIPLDWGADVMWTIYAEWPRIEFELPSEQLDDPSDPSDPRHPFHSVYQAGRRAGYERERRALDAIIGTEATE